MLDIDDTMPKTCRKGTNSNELAALTQDTILILDDYHLIREQAIHESVQFLLENLPPRLHLLLASRSDPQLLLPRLRARGQVVEIRETDLRLSDEEAMQFLTQVMDQKLTEEQVGQLKMRTTTSYILAFNMLFPFSHQQQEEKAYIQQLQEEVELLLQGEDQATFPSIERDRLHYRIMVLKAWNLVAGALSDGNAEQLNNVAEMLQQLPLDDDIMWQQHRLAPFTIAWRMAGDFTRMVATIQEIRRINQLTQNRYLEVQYLWWGLNHATLGNECTGGQSIPIGMRLPGWGCRAHAAS